MNKSVNSLSKLMPKYAKGYSHFLNNSYAVKEVQTKKLLGILKNNKNSDFGKEHFFSKINCVSDFRKNVKIHSYEDYEPYIMKLTSKNNVLTSEKIVLLQPTSGSSSVSKLIPYTAGLNKEFLASISSWLYSLYIHHKSSFIGKHYWSITPNITKIKKHKDIQVGFDSDEYYLGSNISLHDVFVVPSEVKNIQDFNSFIYVTQFFLLLEKNLSFISVWNPSLIQVLFQDLDKNFFLIINDIKLGKLNKKLKIPRNIKILLSKNLNPDIERARELEQIYLEFRNKQDFFHKIFPKLSLISCWTDGNAKISLNYIRENFSKTIIQPKGLIATECIVSIPFKDCEYPALAYTSHFFEFIQLDKELQITDNVVLAHELKANKKYCVVVTTSGGLYRYNLKDIVLVKGFFNNVPLLEFLGRLNCVSDFVGEKLHEVFVKNCILSILEKNKVITNFAMLSPEKNENGFFYMLFLESHNLSKEKSSILKKDLENELLKNYHYAYARKLSQLAEVKIFLVDDSGNYDFLKNENHKIKLGDIKNKFLSKELNLSKKFRGKVLC